MNEDSNYSSARLNFGLQVIFLEFDSQNSLFSTFEQYYDTFESLIFTMQRCNQGSNVRLQPYGCNLVNCEFFLQEVADLQLRKY